MKLKKIAIAISVVLFSVVGAQATAGLYVSSVKSPSVGQQVDGKAGISAAKGAGLESVVVSDGQSSFIPQGFGKGMPLELALTEILPHAEGWKANIDSDIKDYPVNWSGGKAWDEVLSRVAADNGISVVYNNSEKVVGVSKNRTIAENLAKTNPSVWRVNTAKSLRENIEIWAARVGWTVYWDTKADYQLNNSAIVLGEFVGNDGVIAQLLKAFYDKRTPLAAEFNTSNSVLRVHEVNYTQKGE